MEGYDDEKGPERCQARRLGPVPVDECFFFLLDSLMLNYVLLHITS